MRKIFKITVTKKSDGRIVYGNQGGEEVVEMFLKDVGKYKNDLNYIIDGPNDISQELTDAEQVIIDRKNKIKDKSLSVKDRLDALVEHFKLDK